MREQDEAVARLTAEKVEAEATFKAQKKALVAEVKKLRGAVSAMVPCRLHC